MRYPLLYWSILIFLFSCKQPTITDGFVIKTEELANRYLQLERFSGSILVAKNEEILFYQSYGLANYEQQEVFTKQTTFEIGALSTLFLLPIFEQLAIDNFPRESSYQVLGPLIEEVLNLPFPTIIEQYLTPLGLKHTFLKKGNNSSTQGYLFYNYRGEGLELEATYDTDTSKYELVSTPLDLLKLANILTEETLTKSGYLKNGGFSYTFKKEKECRIIILSNRRHPVSNEMAESILSIYQQKPYELPLLRQPIKLNPVLYQDYIGIYEVNPQMQFEVLVDNDSLFTLMMGQKMHLIPQSTNQYYYQTMDAAIRFVKSAENEVTHAILYNGFLEGQTINKVK